MLAVKLFEISTPVLAQHFYIVIYSYVSSDAGCITKQIC